MNTSLAFFSGTPGGAELLLVAAAVLMLFGPRKLPEVARMIGKALEQLRRASRDFRSEIMNIDDSVPDSSFSGPTTPPAPDDDWSIVDADAEPIDGDGEESSDRSATDSGGEEGLNSKSAGEGSDAVEG
jgi:TatA/E family protein of Tat protein translocase